MNKTVTFVLYVAFFSLFLGIIIDVLTAIALFYKGKGFLVAFGSIHDETRFIEILLFWIIFKLNDNKVTG